MCQFCEEPTKDIKLHRQETDSNISECFIHKCDDGAALFLRESLVVHLKDKGLKISQDNEMIYMDIKYCPFCGRKL